MRRNKSLRNRRNDITQGWEALQSLISPSKGKDKKQLLQHVVYVVGHSSRCGRDVVSGRDVMLSLWYSDSQLENGSSVNSDNFDVTDLRF